MFYPRVNSATFVLGLHRFMKELKMMEVRWPVMANFIELFQNMPAEAENMYINFSWYGRHAEQ
jgi:hypothetical protein